MRFRIGVPVCICIALICAVRVGADIIRGPYLQLGAVDSVVVRWRTLQPSESLVRFGGTPGSLDSSAFDPTITTEHEVRITGLMPGTRYFYSVGTPEETWAGGPECFFITSPLQAKPTRIWVLGDSGTAGAQAAAVRDAYQAFTGTRHTDLWLMLGDNAYETGLDEEYQLAVFQMYPDMLRKSVLWPTIGNHDAPYTPFTHFPYLDIFTAPTQGEAGGVASGTERYYSFDYGNIHFVCLDSMTVSRGSNGPMCNWLRADLEANEKDWLIAYWHHPPYSRGSHNSDYEFELVEMRQNVVPLLEEFGVDLMLAGHSHSYERSYLLDGHYGRSETLQPHMIKDASGGRPCETGGYVKSPGATRAGAVYSVCGSSGQVNASDRHPAMYMHLSTLGSLVLDINGDLMHARFLDSSGRVADEFSIVKGSAQVPCLDPGGSRAPDVVWKTNGHSAGVRCVAFAPGGSTLASSGEDGQIKLWAVSDGALKAQWRADQGITDQILYLQDASYLLSSGTEGRIKFWQTAAPIADRILEANFVPQSEMPIAYSAVDNLVASSTSVWHPFGYWISGAMNLWRASDGAVVRTIVANSVLEIDFSPTGGAFVSASDGTVRLWLVSDGAEIGQLPVGFTRVVKYSPDGNLIATGGPERTVQLWRASDRALLHSLIGHNDTISALAFSPDGTTIVTAGQFDSTLRFWRVADGQLLRTFTRDCYAVNSIAFSVDGHLFAYGREDNIVMVARNPFPPVGVTVSDGEALEGGSAQFTVRLNSPVTQPASVSFMTINGSAIGGVDFVQTNGVLSFAPGESNKTITIRTLEDSFRETNEFFRVALLNPINCAIRIGYTKGVIVDNDPLPILVADEAALDEDNGAMVFEVLLSEPTQQMVTFDYFTDNGSAYAPDDYEPALGSLAFAPGETRKTISVSVREDTSSEPPEALEVRFINVKNAVLATPAVTGWIMDDDNIPGQLSHFEWDPIGVNQVVNEAFPVTIRAKDANGGNVPTFSGAVALRGVRPPTALFRDDFEDGSVSDWIHRGAAYVRAVTNDTAAAGTYCLTLIGGGYYRMDGVARALEQIQPGRISFHVRASSAVKRGGHFVAATNDTFNGVAICFRMDGTNGMGLEERGRFHAVPYVAHRWYKISLVLDWSLQQVAYYVDGQLVEQSVPFCTPVSRPLNVVHLYNFDHTQCWWDNFEFLQEPESTLIAISPATTGNFVNGIWSGEVTVQQPGTNMLLTAEANDRIGIANVFSAIGFPPIIVQRPISQSVVAGGNVTFSALTSGTLPMEYEWRRLLPPHTNTFLLNDYLSFFTLTNVQPTWASGYRLTVRSVAGSAIANFLLTTLADTDADGLPDNWESDHNLNHASADADSDGMSNLAEYQAGTVPTNASSVLRLTAGMAGAQFYLQFPASSNKTYRIEQTPDLQNNWSKLVEIPARASNYTYRVTNVITGRSLFRLLTPVD